MDYDRARPNFFAGPYIDRRSEARELPGWWIEALADPASRYLIGYGTSQLMLPGAAPRIAFLPGDHPLVRAADERQLILLGWFRGARCVLVHLDQAPAAELVPGASFEDLRPLSNLLPAEEAGLLAYARGLAFWRSRNRFCGTCGAQLSPERAGHAMRCTNHDPALEVFPRIDPAIIVLVSDGERALLGRQESWPPGRYSTIAGFAEPGESLEDTVAREVMEETGVAVAGVHYDSSQPWPFPSSLMLGFHAEAQPDSIVRVNGELEDARWFTRTEILSGTPLLPPPHAISYRLIAAWLARAAAAGP